MPVERVCSFLHMRSDQPSGTTTACFWHNVIIGPQLELPVTVGSRKSFSCSPRLSWFDGVITSRERIHRGIDHYYVPTSCRRVCNQTGTFSGFARLNPPFVLVICIAYVPDVGMMVDILPQFGSGQIKSLAAATIRLRSLGLFPSATRAGHYHPSPVLEEALAV